MEGPRQKEDEQKPHQDGVEEEQQHTEQAQAHGEAVPARPPNGMDIELSGFQQAASGHTHPLPCAFVHAYRPVKASNRPCTAAS